ncbi:MAG: RluA family pseudouridine synthase [Acidimicrobiaceae bacterium]|nr:RluA family pseudouridine synthase [Acidimicrobiaceae bacterium]
MSDDSVIDAFDGEVLDLIVPGSLDSIRIDRVLSMLTGLSRSEASTILESGAVTLGEKVVVKASTLVETGQHLIAILPAPESNTVLADAGVLVDVVLDDVDFAVINKAAGQVVHPGAGQRHGTLVAGLLARYPQMQALSDEGICDPLRPGIVHRLDKGTSGLLVVAKTVQGFVNLSAQLADRLMERTYLGMVEGHVSEDRGVVDAPIGRSTRTPTMMAVRADGRPARTGYEVVARIEKPQTMTLLRLQLDTGRTHQIRVHLATIGHPVVNDPRYGHRRDKRLAEDRFFLHSTALSFAHPRSDEWVTTSVALPEDLAALVPGSVQI